MSEDIVAEDQMASGSIKFSSHLTVESTVIFIKQYI